MYFRMKKDTRTSFIVFSLCIALVVTLGMPGSGHAQKKFPSGPVKIIVAQKAGGAVDIVTRTFQPYFSKYLNTPVVIDNVEGAGGKIGRMQAYKAKPDGYTLSTTGFPASALGQKMENPGYHWEQMTCIYNITGGDYNIVAVPYDSPIKTLDDLKKLGQTKNVKISGSGIGNNSYLAFFFLKSRVGIPSTYIPYDSGADAAMAVIAKQVDAGAGSVVSFSPLAEQKRIRVILCAGPNRHPLFPDAPTFVELGYAGSSYDITLGLFGPPAMPADIAKTLEDAAAKALADPGFKEMSKKVDFTLVPASGAEMKKMLEEQGKMLDDVVPEILAALKAAKKK